MEAKAQKTFSLKEWITAARPKTLPTAIIPFLAGTFLAYAQGYAIRWELLLSAWLSALCIQIGTNITNDAYDFKCGTDHERVLGPQRATRAALLSGVLSFEQVLRVGLAFFAAALLFGIPLILHGGAVVGVILLLSVASGFLYTGGPYPLAYHGLGDLFVLLFYGGVAVNAAYWLQTGELNKFSLLLSAQIGCLCTSMIAVNNLRDVHDDVKTGKRTLPVRFGVAFGQAEIATMLLLPLLLNLLWPWPAASYLPLLSFPLAAVIIFKIVKYPPCREYNKFLAMTGANMLSFTLLLAMGFALS